MTFIFEVLVTLKPGLSDPQGKAVEGALPTLGWSNVRDWLDESGWDHEPPAPDLPPEVVERTAARYREAYERLTGEPFEHYRRRMGVPPDDRGEGIA